MATYTKRDGRWRVQVRKGGVSTSAVFATKAEAVAWAVAREHEINIGKYNAGSSRTVEDALKEYEKRVSRTRPSGRWDAIRMAAFIRDFPKLAGMRLDDFTREHAVQWRDTRIQQVSAGTVLREHTLLSAIFSRAVKEWGWLKVNPWYGLKLPKQPDARKRRITNEEIEKLLFAMGYEEHATPHTKTARTGAFFLFALETAMRAGEIGKLRWEDICADGRIAHLPKTKNGHARDVPLSPRARAILAQLSPLRADFDGLIFGLSDSARDALFRKAVKSAMIEGLHFHDARREALTRLAKIIQNPMDLAKISGHRDLRMLQNVYYAPSASDLADALERGISTNDSAH